jgi:hypothetical protein
LLEVGFARIDRQKPRRCIPLQLFQTTLRWQRQNIELEKISGTDKKQFQHRQCKHIEKTLKIFETTLLQYPESNRCKTPGHKVH